MSKVVRVEHVPDPKPEPIPYVRLPTMDELQALFDDHPAPTKMLIVCMRHDGSVATWYSGMSPLETLGIMDVAKMIILNNDEDE